MQQSLPKGVGSLDATAEAVRNGGASGCRKVVEDCLATIRDQDGTWHAWSSVMAAAARSSADRLDDAGGAHARPLRGAPIGVKDLVQIRDHTPSFGSRACPSRRGSHDAPLVTRLREAGGIVLGATHLVEFAFGSWGTNAVMGTPRNPVDPGVHRVPGGSSSGSAVAVAAGMVPAAIGTDTGGSVRIPAALCGLVGFKPPTGTIPMEGVLPLSPTLDTVGPLAHRLVDARRIDAVLSDRACGPLPASLDGCRVMLVEPEQWGEVQPEVADAVNAAAAMLRSRGCKVETAALPEELSAYQALNGVIMAAEAYARLREVVEDRSLPMDEHVRGRVLIGRDIGAEDLAAAKQVRTERIARFRQDYGWVDAVMLPTTPFTAIPVAEVDETQIPMSRLTRFANYLDLAALSVPYGTDGQGLPIGLQLAAFGERMETLFAIGAALDA